MHTQDFPPLYQALKVIIACCLLTLQIQYLIQHQSRWIFMLSAISQHHTLQHHNMQELPSKTQGYVRPCVYNTEGLSQGCKDGQSSICGIKWSHGFLPFWLQNKRWDDLKTGRLDWAKTPQDNFPTEGDLHRAEASKSLGWVKELHCSSWSVEYFCEKKKNLSKPAALNEPANLHKVFSRFW